jgi:hypothetical protein
MMRRSVLSIRLMVRSAAQRRVSNHEVGHKRRHTGRLVLRDARPSAALLRMRAEQANA